MKHDCSHVFFGNDSQSKISVCTPSHGHTLIVEVHSPELQPDEGRIRSALIFSAGMMKL